jgi:hypothetical protein
MKRLLLLFGVAFYLLGTGVGWAQAVSTQQTAARLDAGGIAFSQVAVGSPSVATVAVPTGYFAYVTGISVDGCQDATGLAVTNGNITSSGLSTNPSWSYSMPLTASACFAGGIARDFPATPVKSLAGTNVTSPTTSHWQYTIRVFYYLAQQ